MELGILSSVLAGMKYLPEYLSGFIILVAVLLSYTFKRSSQDHQQVTEVSKLQTEQLKVLIEQNEKLMHINAEASKQTSEMNQQIQSLRSELSEAYTVIDSLRYEVHVLQRRLDKGE